MWRITLGEIWKAPKKGGKIMIMDVDKDDETIWVKQTVTKVVNGTISTEEYNDVKFSDLGETWKFPKAK